MTRATHRSYEEPTTPASTSCSRSVRVGCVPGGAGRPVGASVTAWCYSRATAPEPWQLWPSAYDSGIAGVGLSRRRAAGRQADEGERDLCCANKEIQAQHRQRSCVQHRAQPARSGFLGDRPQPEVGRRYQRSASLPDQWRSMPHSGPVKAGFISP